MSCKVHIKLTQDLVDRNIISENNEIKDIAKFDKMNELYTKVALEKYNFDTYGKPLYNVEDSKAVPNEQLMDLYDDVVVDYENERVKEPIVTKKEVVKVTRDTLEKLSNKYGINIVFKKFDNESYQGEYNPSTHTININETGKDIVNTIFHEISHPFVTSLLANNPVLFENILKKANEAYPDIVKDITDNKAYNTAPQSWQNEEIIVRTLEREYVEDDFLKEDSLWDTFIKYIKNIFNISNINATSTLAEVASEIINSRSKVTSVSKLNKIKKRRETEIMNAHMNNISIQQDNKNNLEKKLEELKLNKDAKIGQKHNIWYGEIEIEEIIYTEADYNNDIKSLEQDIKFTEEKIEKLRYKTIEDINEYNLYYKIKDLESDSEQDFLNIEEEVENRTQREYYDLSTIEKRQQKVVNGIKDNLEESIRKYDTLIRKLPDPSKIKKYSDKLKKVFADIEAYDEANNWLAISTFVGELTRNINSLKQNFNKEDLTADDIEKTVGYYQKYLTSHALIGDISKFISDAKASGEFKIPRADIIELQNQVSIAKGEFDSLNEDLKAMQKKFVADTLNDKKYASEVLHKWKVKLEKQHKELKIQENKTTWVNKQMNSRYKDQIDADVKENANKLVNDVHFDINNITKLFVSGISTNSKMIQVMQNIINQVRSNIIERTRDKDFELKDLFDKFIDKVGNKRPSEQYKNLLEYDKEGNAYLKGEYKLEFRDTYQAKLKEYNELKTTTASKYGINSPEYNNLYKNSEFKRWVAENTKAVTDEFGTETRTPIKKWHNDLSELSEVEQQALLEFRKISNEASKQTFGIKSLVSPSLFGGKYYSLPAVTKSGLERVLEKQVAGSFKDKWHDLTEVRPDDIGYETSKTDIAGNPIYDVKINFRGKLKPNQQSLDLFTIYRLEARNGINFDEKHKAEGKVATLVDIAKEKTYYRHTASRVPFMSINAKRNKISEIKGEDSVTYERMVSLMESNIYDILHKDAGKIGKLDVNKVVGAANGWTAKLGMWINEVAGTVNVLNGKAQLFLETIAGNHIKGSSLAKAEKIYFAHLADNMKDIKSPIKTSLTNQINEMFDTFGTISTSVEQAFLKNTIAKATLNEDSLQFIQEGGEHWLQSTLTMGVLDTIKVLNKDGNFINKLGEVVEEKDAASMLDMLTKVDGKLTLDKNVVYTTKTLGIEYNKGGKEAITNLIKAKIFATMGNYDANMQPEAMRHAKYKLVMMFRKYFVEMGLSRWRGIAFVDKKQEDLFDEERFYSEAEQEYIEGMYTSTLRYAFNSVIPALKSLNFKLLSTDWNSLSDYEKKNIHKTIVEIAITSALLPAIGALLVAIKGDDDDDKEYIWFLMLVTRRLQSEIEGYRDVREQYKILNSPIPSLRLVQNAMNLGSSIMSPGSWTETYKDKHGIERLKIGKDFKRMTPILNSTNSTYKQKYQYMMYMTN